LQGPSEQNPFKILEKRERGPAYPETAPLPIISATNFDEVQFFKTYTQAHNIWHT